MTNQCTPLGLGHGNPNVFTRGQPDWRGMADIHQCPIVKVVVPDGPGVVINGSQSVLINGFPACPVGDTIQEAISVNTIAYGLPRAIIEG